MPQQKGDPKGWYIMPQDYLKHKSYIEKYMPHWLMPFELTYRGGLRPFETGLARRNGHRVMPIEVHSLADLPYSQTRIKGKHGKVRPVDVPFTSDRIRKWYFEEAPNYKLESYEQFIWRRGLSSYCGRKTYCINMMILFNPDLMTQIAIRTMTGHIDDVQMEVYIGESYSIQRLLSKADIKIIEEMLCHIQLPRRVGRALSTSRQVLE